MRYVKDVTAAFVRNGVVSAALVAASIAGSPAQAQAPAQAPAPAPSGPVFGVTYVSISADWVLQGGGLLKQYRDQSLKEPGNIEFKVMQETTRPDQFIIVEGWQNQAAATAHEKGANASLFNFTLEAIRTAPPTHYVVYPFATGPAKAAPAGAVYVIEHMDIIPPRAAEIQPVLKSLAEASQKDPGTLRYDAYQVSPPRVNHFAVVSAYTDAKAYEAHEASAQAKAFRAATAPPVRGNLNDQRIYKDIP